MFRRISPHILYPVGVALWTSYFLTAPSSGQSGQIYSRLTPWLSLVLQVPDTPPVALPTVVPGSCSDPHYEVHILSYFPLAIYIENFVTDAEKRHLIALAEDKYERSHVQGAGNNREKDFNIVEGRTSSTAVLENDDTIVNCIRLRAGRFQGMHNTSGIENLNVVRYLKGQKYDYHWDWYPESPREEDGPWDRWTSFFVFLEANSTIGGTTHFPAIRAPNKPDKETCRFVECQDGMESLAVKPVSGNAIFWVNRTPNGQGDKRSLHAGKPVLEGTKIGMNIWTEAFARGGDINEASKVF